MMAKHGKARKSKQRAEKVLKILIEVMNKKEVATALIFTLDLATDGQVDGFGLLWQ